MTLYELTEDYQRLLDMAEEEELDPETLAGTLELIEGEIEDKADGYCMVIRQLTADSATIAEEIKRLKARQASIDGNAKKLKTALGDAMLAIDMPKIKTALFSVWMQKNPASVVVDDERAVPDDFWKQPAPVMDTAGIKKYLTECGKLGLKIEWAHLEQSESLRMR